MTAVTLGPLVLSAERLAFVAALAVFLLVVELLARRVDMRIGRWSWAALAVFVLAARLGHVLEYLDSFRAAPWRVLALWQGGFKVQNGVVAALVLTLVWFRGDGRPLRWPLLPGALALGVAAVVLLRTGEVAPVALPDRPYALLDGGTLNPAELKGRPVVANLWATWCGPCRREMPMLAEVAGAGGEVAFLFVNQREDPRLVANYLDQNGLKLGPVLLDSHGDFARHFASVGLPSTLFIGRDGVLKAAHIGEISREVLLSRIAQISR